ncbi:MAG: heat-inducible transcriptional repressor HrcA [Polyangiaceae bacterium]
MAELSQRARQLLYHAVMEYVSTGEPVGSRTLSKKSGLELSAASIRNVLADLEELGYLRQPHTSAGRVPTDRAFRLFIDALMETREISPEDHARIRERFEAIESGGNLFRETGRLLSELTGTAALVVAPRAEALSLKTMRFVRTRPGELLAVLVMTNGTVQNRFVPASVAEDELVRVHNLLDDVVEGRTLGELRELFARRLGTEKVRADELRRTAFELGGAAVRGAADQGADIVIEGQAKLLGQPEFSDATGVKSIVNALDERDNLVRLLDATLVARGVTILVGSEAGDLGGGQLSIVGTAYTDRGRTAGSVGVIGPTRMNYPKVVPLVTATASAMSAYIERESGKHHDDDDE